MLRVYKGSSYHKVTSCGLNLALINFKQKVKPNFLDIILTVKSPTDNWICATIKTKNTLVLQMSYQLILTKTRPTVLHVYLLCLWTNNFSAESLY